MDDEINANDCGRAENNASRRRFMAASALVGAGAFGLGGPVGSVAANEHGDDGTEENGADGEFEDDVDVLNYARTLEFLEADFYRQALENMSERDLVCTDPIRQFGDPIQDRVYGDLETIQEHEETHAEVLGSTIEDLGGEPIDEPEFEFGAAVEARHASFLRVLGGDVGFPAAFDEALDRTTVEETAGQFIVE